MWAIIDNAGNCVALLSDTEKASRALDEGWLLGKSIIMVTSLQELATAMMLPKVMSVFHPEPVRRKTIRKVWDLKT